MNYEQRYRNKLQKRVITITILLCISMFIILYFSSGFLLSCMKDETVLNETCEIHNLVDINRDYDKLIAAVKKDFPDYKINIEMDNLEGKTVVTIYKSTDYKVRVNFDENMNYFSSRLIDNFAVNMVPSQLIIAIIGTIVTMVMSILVGTAYICKKMEIIVS